MSREWLSEAVRGPETVLNREAQGFLDGKTRLRTAREQPLNPRVRRSAEEMLKAPLQGQGAGCWFRAKILEITALTLIEPGEELFCERHKRLAIERVERVKQVLARDLENPPTLSQLGREVGCSPFYLSRIFSSTPNDDLALPAQLAARARAPRNCSAEGAQSHRSGMAVGY